MRTIQNNFQTIVSRIHKTAKACGRNPEEITLVAVSKKKSVSLIQSGINAGIRHLGENYIQEAVDKIDTIGPVDGLHWHFIGHLQSNKAKFAVPYFDLIHTVDSFKLAKEIDKQAVKAKKVQDILLQVNISREQTKSGTGQEQIRQLAIEISALENVAVKGLMCMPPFFDDPEKARPYFRQLARIRKDIQDLSSPGLSMEHLSMGMSNDFEIAIEEGATHVRVGTSIFGSRQ
jgi:pyridoxal phosphate enzyme (YggS family)